MLVNEEACPCIGSSHLFILVRLRALMSMLTGPTLSLLSHVQLIATHIPPA